MGSTSCRRLPTTNTSVSAWSWRSTSRNVLGQDERIQIFAGCNVSDQPKRWRTNYRCPDVAVFLPGNPAEDRGSHWFGGPDFAVEILSRFDRIREKFGFYAKVGVRELLLVDRRPGDWSSTEDENDLGTGRANRTSDEPESSRSQVLPLTFRLISGQTRPRIEVARVRP